MMLGSSSGHYLAIRATGANADGWVYASADVRIGGF